MSQKMRVAFVGFRHGHINGLYNRVKDDPNFTIAGACEENEAAAKAIEAEGVKITHRNFHRMLDELGFDILAIGDYFAIRGARAIAGLVAGKHVIADKPLCTSLAELWEIRRLSEAKHLVIGEMLDMRRHGNMNAAKEIIDSGRMGEIHAIQFGGQHPLSMKTRPGWYFEPGKHGGTINDIAIHGLDAVEYLTGHKIANLVAARCWNAFADKYPVIFQDAGQAMFTLDNKCGVMADVSYFAPEDCGFANPFYWRFTLWGRKGVMEFNYNDPGVKLYLAGAEAPETVPPSEQKSDYWDIFTGEINGTPHPFGSKHIIGTSEKALLLQQMADRVHISER